MEDEIRGREDERLELEERFAAAELSVREACKAAGRPASSVTLLAASKTQPAERMNAYTRFVEARGGRPVFGENYVQELKRKRALLRGDAECHLIGPLQRNKARDALRLFDVIQSVHDEDIAGAIEKEAAKLGVHARVLMQVNISRDPAKSGFEPDEVKSFLGRWASAADHLALEGFMTITRDYDEPELARPDFRALRELATEMQSLISAGREQRNLPTLPALTISMGMSADFEVAIAEGSTLIRLGTVLFGTR